MYGGTTTPKILLYPFLIVLWPVFALIGVFIAWEHQDEYEDTENDLLFEACVSAFIFGAVLFFTLCISRWIGAGIIFRVSVAIWIIGMIIASLILIFRSPFTYRNHREPLVE